MSRCTATVLILSTLSLAGCTGAWNRRVVSQASFDHQCSEDSIVIGQDDGNKWNRTVVVTVCGECRVYRDLGEEQFMWTDVTDETELCDGASSPAAAPQAAADGDQAVDQGSTAAAPADPVADATDDTASNE